MAKNDYLQYLDQARILLGNGYFNQLEWDEYSLAKAIWKKHKILGITRDEPEANLVSNLIV